MTKQFKKILLIRFFAYFAIITGSLVLTAEFGPVVQAELGYRVNALFGVKHTLAPTVITSSGQQSPEPSASSVPSDSLTPTEAPSTGFGSLFGGGSQIIKPVSTDYGIVIEKINANSKVIPQVDPSDEKQYVKALAQGVAEAKGSTEPGKPGNIYMFSHSVDAPWNIIRYNAVFYLLRELEPGDRVILFYQGRRFDYIVFDKTIVDPKDVSFLTNRYDKPVLTLQTCDPPGTLINRLIVRAKLAGS